jgi:hypothetical protein
MRNSFTAKYLKNKKGHSNLEEKYLDISSNNIDTIIETLLDYARILTKALNNTEGMSPKLRIQYELKIKECNEIAETLIQATGYCKECKNARRNKKDEDVGRDAMEMLATGYRR